MRRCPFLSGKPLKLLNGVLESLAFSSSMVFVWNYFCKGEAKHLYRPKTWPFLAILHALLQNKQLVCLSFTAALKVANLYHKRYATGLQLSVVCLH